MTVFFQEREAESRESKRGSRKSARFDRDYETSSTAAYHTESQPRPYRATRSYAAGEVSDDDERYEYLNKSIDLKRFRDEVFNYCKILHISVLKILS